MTVLARAISLPAHGDRRPVAQVCRWRAHQLRAAREPLDLAQLPVGGADSHRSQAGPSAIDREYYTAPVALDDRARGNQQARARRGRRTGPGARAAARLLQEGHAYAHVRQDARILLIDADAHLDGGLAAIGCRNDGNHVRGDGPVRIGIEHGLRVLPGLHAIDVGLVDVDLDLERVHVDDGADAGAREAAAGR